MTPERRNKIHSVLSKRQPDLTVITDHVIKDRNLAAMVRTCDAVGVQTLHSISDPEHYRTYRGTSASAQKYVGVRHHCDISEVAQSLKQQGFSIVAAQLSDESIDYRKVDFTQPTALLMGAEIEGVSAKALSYVDQQIIVPMMGMVESFNVSVACAVILSEAQRQREEKGMYDESRMGAAEYKSLFFRWAYPKMAAFCDERNMPYPELDENDDLIPGSMPSSQKIKTKE